jgi:DNA repair exonuclease SbcCD nuclease subunit
VKRLIVTDTHLGLYQDSDKWLDIVLQFFKDLTLYCYREQISEVIHLGDFFDNRKSLNTKTQHTAHRIAKILALRNLNIKIIVGNHDCYFKNQIHPTSLELFEKYSHIDIIDEPTVVDDILLIPWGSPIEYPECTGSVNYCFGHFAINGFHMNDSYVCKTGMESAAFKDFDLVLSGHFHTPSKQGNITYLGAPYGQTFHDVSGSRGFYIFEDGKLEFIEYHAAPKFIKIRTEAITTHTSLNDDFGNENINGNVVRLVFDKDYGTTKNQQIQDEVLKYEPFAYSIDFTKIENEEMEVNEAVVESREQMLTEYITAQTYAENIKVPVLVGMFKKVMGEADEN